MNDWFFREGYESGGDYVSREVMLKRLESYIKQVITHFQDKYPGVIYAWDVVNEAVANNIAVKNPYGVGTIGMDDWNLFYKQIGADYVQKAFEYARKYADPDVKLYYNDWGCDFSERRNVICKLVKQVNTDEKLIDGIGLESYQDIDEVSLQSHPNKDQRSVIDALNMYYELGVELQITEFCIVNDSASRNDAQAEYMYQFMELLKEFNKDKNIITNVSIWGIVDRPKLQPGDGGYPGQKYAGIFTMDYQPKESFVNLYKSLKDE